jgi:copper chaperone CopZ
MPLHERNRGRHCPNPSQFFNPNTIVMKYSIVLTSLLLYSSLVIAQKDKPVTTTFWVAGVCGRCESTIEKALDTKGIITADYDLKAHQLTVTYKPAKIKEEQIHHILNEAGYDTAASTCTDEQYSRTHECCKYREMTDH